MRRTLLIPTALVLSALALSGCAAAGSPQGTSSQVAPQAQPGTGPTDGSKAMDSSAAGGSSGTVLSTDRQVIETGYVTVVVDKPLDAATEAARITEQAGGRVDGRNEYAPTDTTAASATLTLRIPVSGLRWPSRSLPSSRRAIPPWTPASSSWPS
jgi:hypothetical protein